MSPSPRSTPTTHPTPTAPSKSLEAELASTKAHLEQVRLAVKAFYAASGRYHSQMAAARMFELVGLPSEFPKGKEEI